jgi:hypothetical protein
MQSSWFTQAAVFTEAIQRISAQRAAERLRFEWKVQTHLLDGGAIVERASTSPRRTFYSRATPLGDAIGVESMAAIIVERYYREDTTLDFEPAP